jgi:hypothetical protein
VNQILPLPDGSLIIVNDFGTVLKTTDTGKHWRKLREHAHPLAVSEGKTLWSFVGWPGVHEPPMAEVWRSDDLGETWNEHRFDVPAERSERLFALLPAVFVNQPAGRPLVLMYDLQLKRPEPWTDLRSWTSVGVPVPTDRAWDVWHGAGVEYRGTYYVTVGGTCIFMSNDGAKTWTATSVPDFEASVLRCSGDSCFSLLVGPRWKGSIIRAVRGGPPIRSLWNGVYTTKAGASTWTRTVELSVPVLSAALKGITKKRAAIRRFEATALVATDDGVYVAGIVNSPYDCLSTIAGKDCGGGEWGVVVRVSRNGKVSPVGMTFDAGVWSLERDSRGVLWAGGDGAFQLQGESWVRMWQQDQ